MSLCAMELTKDKIYIKFANNYEFKKTVLEIEDLIKTEKNKTKVLNRLREEIFSNIGDLIDPSELYFNFDDVKGEPLKVMYGTEIKIWE